MSPKLRVPHPFRREAQAGLRKKSARKKRYRAEIRVRDARQETLQVSILKTQSQ